MMQNILFMKNTINNICENKAVLLERYNSIVEKIKLNTWEERAKQVEKDLKAGDGK